MQRISRRARGGAAGATRNDKRQTAVLCAPLCSPCLRGSKKFHAERAEEQRGATRNVKRQTRNCCPLCTSVFSLPLWFKKVSRSARGGAAGRNEKRRTTNEKLLSSVHLRVLPASVVQRSFTQRAQRSGGAQRETSNDKRETAVLCAPSCSPCLRGSKKFLAACAEERRAQR